MHVSNWLAVLPACLAVCAPAFGQDTARDDAVAQIMQADRDFAALAAEAGVRTAFETYMDPAEGHLINGTPAPLVGQEDIGASFAAWPDGLLLHWEPETGFASEAGDFGASWGIWSIHPDGDPASAPAGRGTYVTVWRRDAAGNWRGLLDMGTDDPSYRPSAPPADSNDRPDDD